MIAKTTMDINQFENRMNIEAAKLGVAEELGAVIAVLAAWAVYQTWGNWWLAIAASIGGYLIITHPYKKREAAASDDYERATGTGKHYRPD